jgi:transposase InsO family protein
VMAFPKSNSQYALITDAATGTADTPGGLGAILTQVDKDGNFHAISFASRQLKDHEMNYPPFLLEAAAAVWGMDFFNEYLKGKRFILYTDHKLLEKLGHLHSKTMNRLQTALLEHDFVIQYKKGSNMPADYLSRLPGTKETVASISAFQTDLYELQMQDKILQGIQTFRNTNQWPQAIQKQDQAYYAAMIDKLFQDKNKVVWVQLNDFKYPRMALYLPTRYRKEAMCEAHDSILGGHNAAHKTYLKISTSYFWPKMRQDIECHQNFCLRCQQRKKSTNKRTPLAPLPIPDCPNLRIHADLFGPMLTADSNKKFVLCITDAFTKYAVVTAIANKEAETVVDAIYIDWFAKFGISVQIHTDGGKDFVNKLSAELFQLLNVRHTKTSPAHPQCNAQVEVFNKTVKKFLQSFVNDTTLNWETFLPALAISYNTSYHSMIATTPFELLLGEKARLPSFPNEDIQQIHYSET